MLSRCGILGRAMALNTYTSSQGRVGSSLPTHFCEAFPPLLLMIEIVLFFQFIYYIVKSL